MGWPGCGGILWTVFMWRCSPDFRADRWLHSSHPCGFLPSCTAETWMARWYFWPNRFSHSEQAYARCFSWTVSTCFFRWSFRLKRCEQIAQMYVFVPSASSCTGGWCACMMCAPRWCRWRKLWSHRWQPYGLTCCFKSKVKNKTQCSFQIKLQQNKQQILSYNSAEVFVNPATLNFIF